MTALVPGVTYILTVDVTNPNPDRRAKYDWTKHAVIPSGAVFDCVSKLGEHDTVALQRQDTNHPSLYEIYRHNALFYLIVPHLKAREATYATTMRNIERNQHACADDLLEELVRQGRLSLDDLKNVAQAYHARVVDEDEA